MGIMGSMDAHLIVLTRDLGCDQRRPFRGSLR